MTYDRTQQSLCLLMDGKPVLALQGGEVIDPAAPYDPAFLIIYAALEAHGGTKEYLVDGASRYVDAMQYNIKRGNRRGLNRWAQQLELTARAIRLMEAHKFGIGLAPCGFNDND